MGVRGNLFLFFCVLYLLTAGGHMYSSDDETHYYVTENIVERGKLSFGEGVDKSAYVSLTLGRNGDKVYSIYNPGQSILAIPLYLVGKVVAAGYPEQLHNFILRMFVSFTNVWVSALAVVVFFMVAKVLYGKK